MIRYDMMALEVIENQLKEVKGRPKPHLRLLPEWRCEYKCPFCRGGGEGYIGNPNQYMKAEEIIKIAELSTLPHIKLSGGEPLLRGDIIEMVEMLTNIKGVKWVGLVTRSRRLKHLAQALKKAGLSSITVSIDTINQIDSGLTEGLDLCMRYDMSLVINKVVTKSTLAEIPLLIKLASRFNAELKLIDLMDVKLGLEEWNPNYWLSEYVPLQTPEILRLLEKRTKEIYLEFPYDGMGTPMPTFWLNNGVKVRLRDATIGTWYSPSYCSQCLFYPCQDALISLRLTHDGHLKTCLIRNDNLSNVLKPLRGGDIKMVKNILSQKLAIYENGEFFPHAWSPEIQMDVYVRLIKMCGDHR